MTAFPDLPLDLLVVGGGINGTGIARDAAGRGLTVGLCDKGDLAGATSSASTKLIHGGLRYLEYYEFRLVREALAEREVLLRLAPHIIWPLRFVLPHAPHLRPAWMIRAGLFLYDHIGGRRSLARSTGLDLRADAAGRGLRPDLTRGFAYSDCWVDDARLVICNAMDLRRLGGIVATRTELVSARREGALWRASLRESRTGRRFEVAARVLVNAAGPWVRQVAAEALSLPVANAVRLVKGSHIVVPRLFAGDHAYILQNPDRRVVFAIPYEGRFTLIGTTDVEVAAEMPAAAPATAEEIEYLCAAAGRQLAKPPRPEMVVRSYSGIRPLYDDGRSDPAAITRDYVLALDAAPGAPPALSVYGGKITTYRRLAEAAMQRLAPYFPALPGGWTGGSALPGGDLGEAGFDGFLAAQRSARPGIEAALLHRLARRHGGLLDQVLGEARDMPALGRDFGGGLFEREVAWLRDQEWAEGAEDILWRRTKCGLHMTPDQRAAFAEWLAGAP